jgi:hypothetical protein
VGPGMLPLYPHPLKKIPGRISLLTGSAINSKYLTPFISLYGRFGTSGVMTIRHILNIFTN